MLARLGTADVAFAVLPRWNATIGTVLPAERALAAFSQRVDILGEVTVPVDFCLMARHSARIDSVRYVGSHPVALPQCSRLFERHPHWRPVEALDSAGAARELAAMGDGGPPAWYDGLAAEPSQLAVIAGAAAANRYGLTILAHGIQDRADNATRFAVLRLRSAG